MDRRKLQEELRKQGIFVHESDPTLDVAAICDTAMADTLKAIEGVVKAAADRTTAAAQQAIEASKKSGEAIISQGAAYLVEQVQEAAREATSSMLAEIRQETAKAERASRTALRAAWLAGGVGALGVAGAIGFLLAGFGHG